MNDKRTDWVAAGKRLAAVVWVVVKATAKAVAWLAKHTFNGSIAVIAAMATVFIEITRRMPDQDNQAESIEDDSIYSREGEAGYDVDGNVSYHEYGRLKIN